MGGSETGPVMFANYSHNLTIASGADWTHPVILQKLVSKQKEITKNYCLSMYFGGLKPSTLHENDKITEVKPRNSLRKFRAMKNKMCNSFATPSGQGLTDYVSQIKNNKENQKCKLGHQGSSSSIQRAQCKSSITHNKEIKRSKKTLKVNCKAEISINSSFKGLKTPGS